MTLYLNWSSLNGRSLNFDDGIHLRRLIFCRSGDDLEIRQNLSRAWVMSVATADGQMTVWSRLHQLLQHVPPAGQPRNGSHLSLLLWS